MLIPKKIFQTFETTQLPEGMSKACLSWKIKNPDWQYCFFDKNDRVEFIKKHFSKDVLEAYLTLIPGAFKADLWRYCVLYIEGGVYIDADTICELPLNDWILGDNHFIATRDDPMAYKWLGNALIATVPQNPILKDCIDRIVKHCKDKQEMFYLDYTGPALLGKCVNKAYNREEETDYEIGQLGNLYVLKHDFGRTKYVNHEGKDILHVEYPGKLQEMESIGNKKFWDYVQEDKIFRLIPNNFIYTSYDILDVNDYMIDSFKQKNPYYNFLYFNQNAVDNWFANSIYNDAYKTLTERGEKSDFFRYCYLYENGGVYADTDVYCNHPLDNFIEYQDLVVGLEANTPLGIFDDIVDKINNNYVSVCNWFIATKPKHPALSKLINDIIANPKNGVLQNTGPGRFTKHVLDYFGRDHNFENDINKDKSQLLSINRFGSNQSHSNAKKYNNPFDVKDDDIYITHMFEGTWRTSKQNDLQIIETEYCSHNLSLIPVSNGYKGVARVDRDTSRTEFMKKLGDCRTLYEFQFDKKLKLNDYSEKQIKYDQLAKFEDYRSFIYKKKMYHSVAYIDESWNTRIGLLDKDYSFIKDIDVEEPNRMRFGVGDEVMWEKNWLFFIHNNVLHFIYNTSPNFVVYKDKGDFEFEKIIDVENKFNYKFPEEELYFSAKVKVGGSTQPIWFEEQQCYIYLVHTKIYNDRTYNHFAVKLNKELNIIDISYKPLIPAKIGYALFFITRWFEKGDNVVMSGGLEDNKNWIWEIPKSKIYNCFN